MCVELLCIEKGKCMEQLLQVITDPNVAIILLTLGMAGLLLELTTPGTYLPGVVGIICLLLAFYALDALQANWIGLVFMALAFVLFVVDIKAPTHGLLTIGGILSFILGGFLLFNTSTMQVPWLTLSLLALGLGAFFAFAISKALAAQRRRPVTGMQAMVGQTAVVRQALTPAGMVVVCGEIWRAEVEDGQQVAAGQSVVVTGYDGFRLHVRQAAAADSESSQAGSAVA